MAHQAHNICWNALASTMKVYSPSRPTKERPVNLYFRRDGSPDKVIRHFITSFVNNIEEYTACERKKYPAVIDVPDPDDIILEPTTVRKISPLVHKWRQTYDWDLNFRSNTKSTTSPASKKLCAHDDGFECGCCIPLRERKASAFLRKYWQNDCYDFYKSNKESFFNQELVKTLLLYGEMQPILRISSHPDVDLLSWKCQAQCYDTMSDAGWNTVYMTTLNVYICLNLLYCFPTLWDPASRSKAGSDTDYRSTYLYQRMVKTCTRSRCTSAVAVYPHKAFFGIVDKQFEYYALLRPEFGYKYLAETGDTYDPRRYTTTTEDKFPYGLAPFEEFLSAEVLITDYLPNANEVQLVKAMLHLKGLPEELVLDVMEHADYTVKRRLVQPHDPFHRDNREELHHYLKYCWRLLVNCNLMAEALGSPIDWAALVEHFLLENTQSTRGARMKFYRDHDDCIDILS